MADGPVQPGVDGGVLRSPAAGRPPGEQAAGDAAPGDQARDETVAVDGVLERQEFPGVEGIPAAERDLADLAPEGALRQRDPASASLAAKQAALPQVDDLAHAAYARQRAEQPLDQRRTRPARTADEDDPDRFSPLPPFVVAPGGKVGRAARDHGEGTALPAAAGRPAGPATRRTAAMNGPSSKAPYSSPEAISMDQCWPR